MEVKETAIPGEPQSRTGNPFLDAMGAQMTQMRYAYPDLAEVSVDFLFVAYLNECSRLGRFHLGPISIDTRVVEDRFAREAPRLPPGSSWVNATRPDSWHRFYATLAREVAASGRSRVDDLHWLMAFLRTREGLPAKVFGELGIRPDDVERLLQEPTSAAEPQLADEPGLERLYSPEEIADYLGVHVQTVRAWVRSGRLPARRIFGQRSLRIARSDLDAVLLPVKAGGADKE